MTPTTVATGSAADPLELCPIRPSEDLIAFAYTYLRSHVPAPPAPAHREIAAILAHPDFACRDTAIMMFRGGGKSTWCSEIFPLHQLLMHPGIYVVIVSESKEVAQDRVVWIRDQLETNEDLIEDWGYQKVRGAWSTRKIELRNGSVLKGLGRGQQVRGRAGSRQERRPNLVILDDIEDPESVESERQREKTNRWVFETVMPALHAHRRRIVFIGTPLHQAATIVRVVEGEDGRGMPGFVTRKYPASTGRRATGKAAWPGWMPIPYLQEKMERLRQSDRGIRAYDQEYDLVVIADEDVVYRPEWFPKVAAVKPPETHGWWKVLALDPAVSEEEGADPRAYCVLGVRRAGKGLGTGQILEEDAGIWSTDEMLERCKRAYRRWDCRYWAYEGTGFQKLIGAAIRRKAREDWVMPVRLIEMPAVSDKHGRGMSVQFLVEQKLIGWPCESLPGGKLGKRLFPRAWAEITTFPAVEHDDRYDAFTYCLRAMLLYWRKSREPRRTRGSVPAAQVLAAVTPEGMPELGAERRAGPRKNRHRDPTGLF